MSDPRLDYLNEAIFCVAKEIIRGIMRRQGSRSQVTVTKIRQSLQNLIGENTFGKLQLSIEDTWKTWKEFLDSIDGIFHGRKRRYYVKKQRQRSIQRRMLLGNLSIEDYRERLLSKVICNLLHDVDINHRSQNNNTTFHLIASLPVECAEAEKFQIGLMELLLKTDPDCSQKNDQDTTALHIVAGNRLLDPQTGLIVSNQRGLSSEVNTSGRLQKLKYLNFKGAPRSRGPKGNSILHEWAVYCASCGVMSDSEMKIGKWISTVQNFQANLVNDDGCTPLHYAFANDLVDFLCSSGCSTDRKNVTGDAPLSFIIKQTLVNSLRNNVTLDNGKDVKEAFAQEAGIDIDKFAALTTNIDIIDLNIDSFKKNNFNFREKDGRNRSCLSYLLLFVSFLATHVRNIPDSIQLIINVVEKWLIVLATIHGEAELAMSEILLKLVVLFFSLEKEEANQILACIENLLKADADPNKANSSNGDTILHSCCKNLSHFRHLKLVEMLCEYGANRSSRNRDSKLPQDLFTKNVHLHTQLLKVLRETRLKRRIDIDIQCVRYKTKLESLCCQSNPKRIDNHMRYDNNFIGRGAMSSIYLSINERSGNEMALKRIDKHYFQKEVKAEIEALKRLEQNQNVVNFYDLLETEDFYYLAIELMDGDLTFLVELKVEFLRTQASTQKLATDIVCGLAFLHKNNMIHRDIKPGNILYREKPECCLKIADFGLTKIMADTSVYDQTSVFSTASTSLCGTRGWMAPELVNRAQSIHTNESDMYALGLVLHYLFSKGFHPFHSCSTTLLTSLSKGSLKPHELEVKISKGLCKISEKLSPEQHHLVVCLLSHNAKKRPASQHLLQQHCYFWSSLKKIKFMWTIGDQPEVAKPSSCPNSKFAIDLQKTKFGQSVKDNPWSQKIYPLFQEVSAKGPRSIDTNSVVGFIRFFRNAYAHFEEQSEDRKVELLEDHIFKEFPEFFITVWIEVCNQGWTSPGQGKDWLLRMIKGMK